MKEAKRIRLKTDQKTCLRISCRRPTGSYLLAHGEWALSDCAALELLFSRCLFRRHERHAPLGVSRVRRPCSRFLDAGSGMNKIAAG